MRAYLPIPVSVATEISRHYRKSQVIILAYDPEHKVTHTTTYGVSAFDKENAAAAGKLVTQAIGCDLSKSHLFEDFHKDYNPGRYKQAVELLQRLLERRDCKFSVEPEIEAFLESAGRPA